MPPATDRSWQRLEPCHSLAQLCGAKRQTLVVPSRRQLLAQLHHLGARLQEVGTLLDIGALLAVLPNACGHACTG
jgi:hypothetical protein